MKINVVNLKKYKKLNFVYIGRRFFSPYYGVLNESPLHNPYKIGVDGNRDEVIQKYKEMIYKKLQDPNSFENIEIERLTKILLDTGELTLACWCKPERCHGDVIEEIIRKRIKF